MATIWKRATRCTRHVRCVWPSPPSVSRALQHPHPLYPTPHPAACVFQTLPSAEAGTVPGGCPRLPWRPGGSGSLLTVAWCLLLKGLRFRWLAQLTGPEHASEPHERRSKRMRTTRTFAASREQGSRAGRRQRAGHPTGWRPSLCSKEMARSKRGHSRRKDI